MQNISNMATTKAAPIACDYCGRKLEPETFEQDLAAGRSTLVMRDIERGYLKCRECCERATVPANLEQFLHAAGAKEIK